MKVPSEREIELRSNLKELWVKCSQINRYIESKGLANAREDELGPEIADIQLTIRRFHKTAQLWGFTKK